MKKKIGILCLLLCLLLCAGMTANASGVIDEVEVTSVGTTTYRVSWRGDTSMTYRVEAFLAGGCHPFFSENVKGTSADIPVVLPSRKYVVTVSQVGGTASAELRFSVASANKYGSDVGLRPSMCNPIYVTESEYIAHSDDIAKAKHEKLTATSGKTIASHRQDGRYWLYLKWATGRNCWIPENELVVAMVTPEKDLYYRTFADEGYQAYANYWWWEWLELDPLFDQYLKEHADTWTKGTYSIEVYRDGEFFRSASFKIK